MCVLSLTAFSLTANAESVSIPTYRITTKQITSGDYATYSSEYNWNSSTLNNGTNDSFYFEVNMTFRSGSKFKINTTHTITSIGGDYLFKKGGEVDFGLYDTWFGNAYKVGTTEYWSSVPDSVRLLLFYSDNSMEYVDNVTASKNGSKTNFEATFTPSKNVIKIEIILVDDLIIALNGNGSFVHCLGEFQDTDKGWTIKGSQQSEESGLLSGIIGWLKNLFDSIANIPSKIWSFFSGAFDTISNWLSNLFNSIVELPSKIADFIKNLFIPSKENLVDIIHTHNEEIWADMGFFGQIWDIMQRSFYEMEVADLQNSIEFPETTINLPQNNTFSFGGQTVPIVPSGFEWLAEICKLVSGIVITILFGNGVFKRYEEVVGVEK